MRGVILAWPRVCLVGRIGFLAKRSLRSFKSRQSWGWALVVVRSKETSAKRMVKIRPLALVLIARRLAYG